MDGHGLAMEQDLKAVLQEHRAELLARLDDWLERLELRAGHVSTESQSRPDSVPQEMLDEFKLVVGGPPPELKRNTSNTSDLNVADMPENLGSKRRVSRSSGGLSSYELAKMAHHNIVDTFRKTQTMSSMEMPVKSMRQSCQDHASTIVNSQWFSMFFGMMVVSNSVLIGASLQMQTSQGEAFSAHQPLKILNIIYAALFTVEAVLRFAAQGFWGYVWTGDDWSWNWLDIFVVVSSWVELASGLITQEGDNTLGAANTNLRVFRLLRVGRMVRVIRIVRVVKFFRSLRTFVQSLVGTLKALFWALVLLLLIIYIFAIIFTDTVWSQSVGQRDERLDRYFGTLYVSMVTLFRSISNGIQWDEPADALGSVEGGFFWVQAFHFYIAFCSFAVLNVLTGVFCNSAIRAAEQDHEMRIMTLVQTRKDLREQVNSLFHMMDQEGRGAVTITDLERHWHDEAVMAFFRSMEMEAMDAWTLFSSLDVDGDMSIGVDEFVERCLQLSGPARSTDLFALRQQTEKLAKQLRRIQNDSHSSPR
ncbi:unnamed protein product [Effrenium voratum]|uniref:EF-hand domain-containing protein n=1 Tax=Effrenium voratum TaxID=2562239 RepID=A0AA36IKL0_9DINO|nr:unnamed protein product [Effrenium voratum]